jgi:hypothetical protein
MNTLFGSSGTMSSAIIVNGRAFRATYTSNTPTAITITLSSVNTAATVVTRPIVFEVSPTTTYDHSFRPVLVARPDNGTLEVFLATGVGLFDDGDGNMKHGVEVKKAIISNIAASTLLANMTVAFETVGVFNEVPTVTTPMQTSAFSSGYYDVETGQYYLPCGVSVSETTGVVERMMSLDTELSNGFCPGYIFDADWNIVDEYLAFADNTFLCPVKTDVGMAFCAPITTGMNYYIVGQVISGLVFEKDYIKTADNVLRLIYSITLA